MITTNRPSPTETLQKEPPEKKRSPVSARAFIVGLVAGLSLCAIGPYNDYYIGATYLSGNFFPISGVAALLLLTMLVNPILIACKKRAAVFTPAEIITVWAMIVVVAGIPSSGMMRYLIPAIVAPKYYASTTNNWDSLIISHLPQRLIITDPNAVKWFFEGVPRGQATPWAAWFSPVAWWSIFVGLMYVIFFSISAIVRKQWVENDHLTFPLVKLPVMLAEEPEPGRSVPSILRSPLLWSAVILCTVLHSIKGLHLLYPVIPDIPTTFNSQDYITTPPLSYVNNIEMVVYPLVIGFSYLLSTEVCLSLWLFYILGKAQTMVASMNAWDCKWADAGICMGPAFHAYQEAGGAIVVVCWLIWSMRFHLKEAFAKAMGRGNIDDSDEPLSYRSAFIGLIVGYIGLFLWLTLAADVQPLMALGVLAGSLVIFILLAWLVAQAGLLFVQVTFAPSQLTSALFPAGSFTPSSLLMGAMMEHIGWFDAREIMLPSIMNSQNAAKSTNLSQRSLTKALGVAIVLAFLVSAVSTIWLPYTHGGGTALSDTFGYIDSPQAPFKWAANQLHSLGAQSEGIWGNLIGGAAFVFILMILRNYVAAFPIHPAGFLVAVTYPMSMLWFSMFIGWLLKAPIMRYGGIKGYRQYMPFFLGLILGDCINAVLWTVVGFVTHTGYRLLPG